MSTKRQPSSKSTVKTTDVMLRGVPTATYKRLKMKAASEGVYLKELIARILSEGIK